MAKKKKVTDAEAASPVETTGATSASVITKNGGLIRIYTKEIHGENFEDLAKQMQAQHAGSTIDVR